MGGDYFALCLAIEELARADSSVAITLEAAVSLGAMPIFRFGTDEQRKDWLPQLTSGEALAAFGLTEPAGGPTAARCVTRADLHEGSWRINGSKAFINQRRHSHLPAGQRRPRDRRRLGGRRNLHHLRADSHRRPDGGPEVLQGRMARVGHP